MNKFQLVFLMMLSLPAASQPDLGKCPLIMISYKTVEILTKSNNGNYMVVVEMDKVTVYEKSGDDYKHKKTFNLEAFVPKYVKVSDTGKIIFIGDSLRQTQTDIVRIFGVSGELAHTIGAEEVLSAKEIEQGILKYEEVNDCTPKKPWICWENRDYQVNEDNNVTFMDVLGRYVDINIDSGKVDVKKDIYYCSFFP